MPEDETICGIDSQSSNGNICGLSFRAATIYSQKDRSKEVPKVISRSVDLNQRKHQDTIYFNKEARTNCWPLSTELIKNKTPFKLREIRYKVASKEHGEELAGIQLLFTNG